MRKMAGDLLFKRFFKNFYLFDVDDQTAVWIFKANGLIAFAARHVKPDAVIVCVGDGHIIGQQRLFSVGFDAVDFDAL